MAPPEVGYIADGVVVNSDPLVDITNLCDVEVAVKGGKVWDPRELLQD